MALALGDQSGGQTLCPGPDALCSSARCERIDGGQQEVHCVCELAPIGLNIGNTTCQKRASDPLFRSCRVVCARGPERTELMRNLAGKAITLLADPAYP